VGIFAIVFTFALGAMARRSSQQRSTG
jgi:hypothetical protein